MNKKCTKCNKEKDLSDFANCKSNKDGLQYQCRKCRTAYKLKNRKRISEVEKLRYYSKKHKYALYLLTDGYVGITTDLNKRLSMHRCHYDRDTNNARVLAYFDNKADAREVEDLLHSIGYSGKYGTNQKSKYR
jgi:hypothetical protein